MMKTIILKVKKLDCKDSCPIPLELIPNVEKTIQKVNYNETSGQAEISYDAKRISKKKIISKLKEIGYEVNKNS